MCYLYFFCLHCLINIYNFDYPDSRLSGLFTQVPPSPDNRGSTVQVITLDYVKISTVSKIDNKACCMYQTTVKWEALQSLSDNLSSLTEWTTIFAIFDMCLISYFLTSTSSFNSFIFSILTHFACRDVDVWKLNSQAFPKDQFPACCSLNSLLVFSK